MYACPFYKVQLFPLILSSSPFRIQKKTRYYLQKKAMPPNRTTMFSPTPAAGDSEPTVRQPGDSCEGAPVGSVMKRSTDKIPSGCTRRGFTTLQTPGTALRILQCHLLVLYLGTTYMCTNILYLGVWQGVFLKILCSYGLQENTQPCMRQEKRESFLHHLGKGRF